MKTDLIPVRMSNHVTYFSNNGIRTFSDGIEAVSMLKEITENNGGTLIATLSWHDDYDGKYYFIKVEENN